MEGQVYLLYEADAWLSYDSMVLMGVFSNDEDMLDAVRTLAKSRLRDNINAYRSFEEGEEYTDEELAAMSDEEREELYDSLVEPIVDEFTKQNLQTQCFDYNFYATEVTLNELNEDGIR